MAISRYPKENIIGNLNENQKRNNCTKSRKCNRKLNFYFHAVNQLTFYNNLIIITHSTNDDFFRLRNHYEMKMIYRSLNSNGNNHNNNNN